MQRVTGFTLVEVMIVVALVGIIAAFAVPQFGRLIDNNRVISTTNSVVGLLSYARTDAVRRGQRVLIRPSVGTDWNSGIVAGVDANGDGGITGAEVSRRIEGSEGTLTLAGENVTFRANGLTTLALNVDVVYAICSGAGAGRAITVSPAGRADVQPKTDCP